MRVFSVVIPTGKKTGLLGLVWSGSRPSSYTNVMADSGSHVL